MFNQRQVERSAREFGEKVFTSKWLETKGSVAEGAKRLRHGTGGAKSSMPQPGMGLAVLF
jgi:hypothetical protein